jgi:hypothetical protein
MRDRRVAASDEHTSVANRQIYGRGSHARGHGAAGRSFDRMPTQITTIVLHQTAGNLINGADVLSADTSVTSEHRIDRIAAHFIVTTDGQPVYLRDVQFILSNAGGRRGIDIEFCGTFGTETTPTDIRLTPEAIRGGRELVRALANQLPSIRFIHPHGQVQQVAADSDRAYGSKYHSCSGPDIWVNVGMWAEQELLLSTTPIAGTYQDHGISPRQANEAYRQEV